MKKIQKLPRFLYVISDLIIKNDKITNSEMCNKNLDHYETDNVIDSDLCVNSNENDENFNQTTTMYEDEYFQNTVDSNDEFNADILEHISYKNSWYS